MEPAHHSDPVEAAVAAAKRSGQLVLDGIVLRPFPERVCRAELRSDSDRGWYQDVPIRRLSARGCEAEEVPAAFSGLENLEAADLHGNRISRVAALSLPALRVLDLGDNALRAFDGRLVAGCPRLAELTLSDNPLEELDFSGSGGQEGPAGREEVEVGFPGPGGRGNALSALPASSTFASTSAPASAAPAPSLSSLSAARARLRAFSPGPLLAGLAALDLSGNSLPFFDFTALPELRTVDLSRNRLTAIRGLGRCARLVSVNLAGNALTDAGFGPEPACAATLTEVNLSDNALEAFPVELLRCSRLVSLHLAGNRISKMDGMAIYAAAEGSRLELLDLAANDLQEVAPELCLLPKLSKLRLEANPMRVQKRIASENSWSRIRDYLFSRLPASHPYFQRAVDAELGRERRAAEARLGQQLPVEGDSGGGLSGFSPGGLGEGPAGARAGGGPASGFSAAPEAPASPGLLPQLSQLPNGEVRIRTLQSASAFSYADTPASALPLDLLLSGSPGLAALTKLDLRRCDGISSQLLGQIFAALSGGTCGSLQSVVLAELPLCSADQALRRRRTGAGQGSAPASPAPIFVLSSPSLTSVYIDRVVPLSGLGLRGCTSLRSLEVTNSRLCELTLEGCPELASLTLSGNRLSAIPECVYGLGALRELALADNAISCIGPQIMLLRSLAALDVRNNNITELPFELGLLAPLDEHLEAAGPGGALGAGPGGARRPARPWTADYAGSLTRISLDGNAIRRPSRTVMRQPMQAVLAFLRGSCSQQGVLELVRGARSTFGGGRGGAPGSPPRRPDPQPEPQPEAEPGPRSGARGEPWREADERRAPQPQLQSQLQSQLQPQPQPQPQQPARPPRSEWQPAWEQEREPERWPGAQPSRSAPFAQPAPPAPPAQPPEPPKRRHYLDSTPLW